MSNSPIVSIVMPAFNIEKYVADAILSVVAQSFTNWELLVVDDGSSDDTVHIATAFMEIDERISIINHENNKGPSAARNTGIKHSKGSIIMFLDADDVLKHEACDVVVNVFNDNQPDILTFGAECFPKGEGQPWVKEALSPRDKLYEGFVPAVLFEEKSRPYVWKSAFSRDFIIEHSLLFDEDLKLGEDQVFYFKAYPSAKKIQFIASKLYDYRVFRRDSLMQINKENISEKLLRHQEMSRRILEYWKEKEWLELYQTEILKWILEFLSLDVFRQKEPLKSELLTIYKATLLDYFDFDDLCGKVDSLTLSLYKGIVDFENTKVGMSLLVSFYIKQRGLLKSVKRGLQRTLRLKA